MTRTGGIEHKSMPNLVRLVQKEASFARRMVLCTVIKSSAPVVLKAIVRSTVLAEVQKWLVAAAGAGSNQIKLAERCLEVCCRVELNILPQIYSPRKGRMEEALWKRQSGSGLLLGINMAAEVWLPCVGPLGKALLIAAGINVGILAFT